jgi:signal transduction histidine kinase
VIRAQAQRLAEFTQRALDAQRLDLESGRLETRPIPLWDEAAAAAARARKASNRDVTLAGDARGAWAWADEAALHSILDNLLDNALRYTPEGSQVEIHLTPELDGFITLAVLDRGPGVPESLRWQVFQQFFRRDAGTGSGDLGQGVGLYISRRLVERMGGRIWAEPRPGGGSRFAFTLPGFTREDAADALSEEGP